jgi:diguanylate cyclase (GGDEF)-like protein
MQTYLTSKVSRRLILQFLLAALIPMIGMTWYVYHQVSALLLNSAYERLGADSKSFGMSLIEILNARASDLKQFSHQNTGTAPAGPKPGFKAIFVQPARNLTAFQQAQLKRGRTILLLTAGHPVEVLVPSATPGEVLIGEIDTALLWANDSAPERYCVLDSDFAALFCTAGIAPLNKQSLDSALGKGNGGTVRWGPSGADFLVGLWRPQFLPKFDSPGFLVMEATPRADALRKLEDFRYLFPIIVLLALALAAVLAIRQIRRQMKPLGLLTEVTHRLAAGDLSARVELAGNDEFTELGRTFNDMAVNLEYKFHMLAMLSELDRAIISASRLEHVASEVLRHIRKAISCDGAGLLVQSDEVGYYLLTGDPESTISCLRTSTSILELKEISRTRPASILKPDVLPREFLLQLSLTPTDRLIAFPISNEDHLEHVLLLAYAELPQPIDHIIRDGRTLADRLAIALSSLAQEEKLYHQAHYDALTDLPNRVLLGDRVEQAIIRAERNQTATALILIDLDNFKQVNDTLGHASGDQLLFKCAMRLKLHIRQGDTLARLGGDEFVILMQDLARGEEYQTLDRLLRELSSALSRPIPLNGHQINTPASMGVALYPENANHFDELLKMADAAMYKSKREQPGGFHFYSSDLSKQSKIRFDLTQELREAVEQDQMILYFQPKVDAHTGQIAGAEALVRWLSPTRGMVLPGVFVHLLDEMGLGIWLGEWVLDHACAQMRMWQDSGLISIPVSINLSPAQFERTSVLKQTKASLERYQLDPSRLEIEILEATAVNGSRKVQDTLSALRAEGIRVALDDFGTGYSSLVYLTSIPANVLKLDQAFIQGLSTDPLQQEIVKHIIALAKTLSYSVVAEGVEEEAQLSLLVAMGCDYIQGYLIGHPLPPHEFANRWLQ